jgi:hypothetical protein
VKGINQFRLTDGAINGDGPEALREFQSGLLFRDNRPKPSFLSFPHPLVPSSSRPRRGRSVRLWGQVRPGDGRRDVSIQFRRGRRGSFRQVTTARTDSRGYFRKSVRARTGQYQFTYAGPGGAAASRPLTLRTR